MSSNLTSIVDFPSKIQKNSSSVIGNLFIGSSRRDCIYIEPAVDGSSDHDARLGVINDIELILNYHN
jgi:hypothetical protein